MSQTGGAVRVSMITVLYGGADVIGDCLRSAQEAARSADLELETVLVDNKPGDGTADAALEVAPEARVISNDENVGFGRACNQGFAIATADWWLLLNPDATLDERALAHLVAFAEAHPGAGAVAPIITGAGLDRAESAGMQPGLRSAIGHFWLLNRLLPGDRGGPWRGLQLHRRLDLGPRKVEWASGGVLLLRPAAIRAVEGFDPSFFLYAEDMDLGRRFAEHGWETWLVPEALAEHSVAGSSGGVTDRWYVALHGYVAGRVGRLQVSAFDLIAASGMATRAVLSGGDDLHRRRMSKSARAALRLAVSSENEQPQQPTGQRRW